MQSGRFGETYFFLLLFDSIIHIVLIEVVLGAVNRRITGACTS